MHTFDQDDLSVMDDSDEQGVFGEASFYVEDFLVFGDDGELGDIFQLPRGFSLVRLLNPCFGRRTIKRGEIPYRVGDAKKSP